jgi:hypothetical protein
LHYKTSILYFHIRKLQFSVFAHGKIKLGGGKGSMQISSNTAHMPEISWISCGYSGNFLKNSGIVPSLDRKRFPPWANEK